MIVITLKPAHEVDPAVDGLGRSKAGWYPGMSPEELYEAGRGCWKLGPRAEREQYVLFVAQGRVRGAMEVEGFTNCGDRRAINGRMLAIGDPIYDTYVDGPDPVPSRTRNPVRYWDPHGGDGWCGCGCRVQTEREFLPGHDQRAIHQRISRAFRSVSEFLAWFDKQFPPDESEAA
ncbi:MAG: hypothetical protein ACRDX8_13735 [Acidimicrobiales bacterium]